MSPTQRPPAPYFSICVKCPQSLMCPLFRWGIWKRTRPGKVSDRTQTGLVSGQRRLPHGALRRGTFLWVTHKPPSFLKTLRYLGKEQPFPEQLLCAVCSACIAYLTLPTILWGNRKAQRG